MKKIIAILCAFAALAACKRIELQDPTVLPQRELKVKLEITRVDLTGEPATRATYKDQWNEGDVVYVFFHGVPAPKYLEEKYVGGEWVATPKNGLTVSDLQAAYDKGNMEMSGVFLPYYNDAVITTPPESDPWAGYFYFDKDYSGIFYQHDWCFWHLENDELRGTLELEAPPIPDTYKYVHFDITGFTEGHRYTFTQEYVRPLAFLFVNDWARPSSSYFYDSGSPIPGHYDKDRSIVSFSGVLDESAVGTPKDYTFMIVDETSGARFTRTVNAKTVSKHTAIGLGNIKDPSIWTAIANPVIVLEQESIEMGGAMARTPGFLAYSVDFPLEGEVLTASPSESWIHIQEISATQVSFYAESNNGSVRTGTITLNYKDAEPKVFTITQYGFYDPFTILTIDEHARDISHEGGSFEIGYSITNPYPDCTLSFRYNNGYSFSAPDWIEGKFKDGVLSYTVQPNTSTSARTCKLLVKYTATPNMDTLVVKQFGKPAGPPEIIAEFNPDAPETVNGAGEEAVSLIAYVRNPVGGVKMELTPDVSWITNIRQNSDMSYLFTASRNTTGRERFGHIKLSYLDQHVTVPFKQLADDVVIILNPGDMTFNYQKRSVSFDVTLPDEYSYDALQVAYEQEYSFVTNLKREGNTVSFDMKENNSGEERTTGIVVSLGGSQSVFHVTQTYEAPVFTVPETELFLNYSRQTRTINVQITNPRENATLYVMEEGNTSWFWSSTQDGVPTLNVSENTTGSSRNTFAVIGYSGMSEKVRLRITQNTSHTDIKVDIGHQYIAEYPTELTFTVKIDDPLSMTDVNVTTADRWATVKSVTQTSNTLYEVKVAFSKNRRTTERSTSITFKYGNLSSVSTIVQGRNRDIPEGFVDLGLPSGTLWAECNLGASTEYNVGTFYAWGEVSSKSKYLWSNYRFGSYSRLTKYNASDGLTVLQDADDVAYKTNAAWSMPTTEDFDELRWHCLMPVWITLPVPGFRITSMDGETSIFFPAAGFKTDEWLDKDDTGYYWTKDLNPDNRANANYFLVNDLGGGVGGSDERSVGMSVRPVIKP